MTDGVESSGARWAWGLAAVLVTACVALAVMAWPPGDPLRDEPSVNSTPATAEQIERGAYLALVGNCGGCHTARGGTPLAGGRGLQTPFGTVFAGNLTPDDATGLGLWSARDFFRAMRHGQSRDGRLLIPAFPYTEYTRVTREDSDALFAYLRSLKPVRQPRPAHALRFPYDTQAALAVWRTLFFRPGEDEPTPGRSAAWQRGAYLVRGLGHCAACHAPRNRLGATDDTMRGGRMPAHAAYAPALEPRPSGSAEGADLIALLRTGAWSRGSVSGPMAEVVWRSTQHWREADLQAAAAYLDSLPVAAPAAPAEDDRSPTVAEAGARLYRTHCADCHGARGEGAAGAYPPLAGNPTVLQPNVANLVQVVQHGAIGTVTPGRPRPYGMPPIVLSDDELAAVLGHVRMSWGNRAGAVSAGEVLRSR